MEGIILNAPNVKN